MYEVMNTLFTLALLFSMNSVATTVSYQPALGPKSTIKYSIPYSLGISEGRVKKINGTVSLDLEHSSGTGEFHVPIDSIDTGSEERDCHLTEALGLNYRVSDFPKEHTCDSKNHAATTGKNAVVFSEIAFKISSIKTHDVTVKEGIKTVTVYGTWTLHGVSRPDSFDLNITQLENAIRVQGQTIFSLKDYGIEVKSAHILFVTISVRDQAKVDFDLVLTQVTP